MNVIWNISKPYSLHKPDKRGDGIDPAIEYLSFAVNQKLKETWQHQDKVMEMKCLWLKYRNAGQSIFLDWTYEIHDVF